MQLGQKELLGILIPDQTENIECKHMLQKPEVSNELLGEFNRLKITLYKVDKNSQRRMREKRDSIFPYLEFGHRLEFQNIV